MKRYYISDENHRFAPLDGNTNVPDDGDGLFDLFLKLWTEDTCAPRLREEWSSENPTAGQCSITAFVIQDIFGGDVYGVPLEGGGYHSFNYIDGVYLDLACEQFHGKKLDFTLNYPQSREEHFASEEKYRRYLLLKEGFDKLTK